jgi:hypothetical protein
LSVAGAVTLTGTGQIEMGGAAPWGTYLSAYATGAVLTNDSTIVGEGHISAVLVNGTTGVIDGKGPGVSFGLYLDNTNTAISNAGLMESTTSGSLIVNDAVNNTSTGQIEAKSGAVDINATVSNAGLIAVNGTATITIASGVGVTDTGAGRIVAFGGTVVVNGSVTGGGLDVDGGVVDLTQSGVSNNVTFLGGGQLELNQSQSYTGQVSGFSKTGANSLDLTDIGFVSANEATFVENAAGTSGVLTVVGSATASITLIGNYSSQTFTTSKDTNGDTIVTASTPQSPSAVHAFAGAMAAFGADHGGSVSTAVQSPRTDHPLLAVSGRAA